MRKRSSTKSSSTAPSRQPDRLLLDADVDPDLEQFLQAVGFQTAFAPRVDVDVTNDTAVLRWARRNGYILVCHDKHSDKQTRLELYPEVYRNGGKIIRISGDSSQDPLVALGKILAQLDGWRHFFAENDGAVVVHKSGIRYQDREKLYAKVQGVLELKVERRPTVKPSRPRKKRRKTPPPDQPQLL